MSQVRRLHPVRRWLIHVVAVLHRWAESGRVRSATATWGFAQSAIVPGPDWALLIPLGLADPKRVFLLALWTTIGSFFGALAAYSIGVFAFERVGIPLLSLVGIGTDSIQNAHEMFAEHALLVVLAGAMGLAPSKVISMTAGGFGVPLLPFAFVILVGRGARFFIVAAIIRFAGSRLVAWIERWVGRPLAALR
jgi:membrane protein YqaA with SNARE-associated domain